ncbi:MAG: type IV secretion system DNA-binding domain-containing protein [Clostridia bacterium]|nr:type IV secretion system DNA-binding domain-containing protein [Clostridia bacterium]
MIYIRRIFFSIILVVISFALYFSIFNNIYFSNDIIFYYAIHPFNICEEQPEIWNLIKISSIIFYFFSNFIFSYLISKKIFNKNIKENKKIKKEIISPLELSISIGYDNKNNLVTLPEKSLYQNLLITGTIGTGKTSSAMYPITRQLIEYKSNNSNEKLGMLILDVKGNYHLQVKTYCEKYNRENDLITIDLSENIKYNPLDKPNLKPTVLANRLKTILLLFSPNNTESFWLDKVEQILAECIKLCRLYNNGYVTFEELHNLVVIPNYYEEKIEILRNLFLKNKFNKEDSYHLLSSLNFFEKEYSILDERTKSILKSEITRITNIFLSDYSVKKAFCPPKNEINFFGFNDVLEKGKIVVLNLNISEYKNLSKLIAAYLKLDFQTEVLNRLSNCSSLENKRSVCFISDEYHEYVTLSDASFYSQSRESKCINIIATQSYTSLLNTLHDQSSVKVIVQNLVNKLWFRSDDILTIEDAQKQIGKEEKEKISKTISENAKETNFNYIFNKFHSKNSSLSESYNSYYQTDFIFDTNFFTQKLETFTCLSFLSDGNRILSPQKLNLIPYFKNK